MGECAHMLLNTRGDIPLKPHCHWFTHSAATPGVQNHVQNQVLPLLPLCGMERVYQRSKEYFVGEGRELVWLLHFSVSQDHLHHSRNTQPLNTFKMDMVLQTLVILSSPHFALLLNSSPHWLPASGTYHTPQLAMATYKMPFLPAPDYAWELCSAQRVVRFVPKYLYCS